MSKTLFTRFELTPRGHLEKSPPPCSWDYLDKHGQGLFAHDLALCTCRNGHACRLVSTVHTINASGVVSPSYVCPAPGCSFHEFVQLVGWSR